jgi:hypothetical protein
VDNLAQQAVAVENPRLDQEAAQVAAVTVELV